LLRILARESARLDSEIRPSASFVTNAAKLRLRRRAIPIGPHTGTSRASVEVFMAPGFSGRCHFFRHRKSRLAGDVLARSVPRRRAHAESEGLGPVGAAAYARLQPRLRTGATLRPGCNGGAVQDGREPAQSARASHVSVRSGAHETHGGPVRRALQLAAPLLCALLVGGCNDADGVIRETPTVSPSTTSATPTPSSMPTTEAQRVLAQYNAFWKILTPVSQASFEQRPAMLKPYATQPVLSRTLRGMRASDNLGQVGYGEIVTRPKIVKIEEGVATIRDCQDASRHGRKQRDTGKVVTRGTEHDLAIVTVKRGSDGIWRVATVDYPGGAC